MAVTETLELRDGLSRGLERDLAAVIVNGVLPRRFSAAELERLALAAQTRNPAAQAAARAARAGPERARLQPKQPARLPPRRPKPRPVPFPFRAALVLAPFPGITPHPALQI